MSHQAGGGSSTTALSSPPEEPAATAPKRVSMARAATLLCLLCAAYFGRFLTGGGFFFSDDAEAFKYPLLEYAKREVLAGRLPLWDPYRFCGMPCLSNLQSGLLYPPNWLCLVMPTERFMSVAMAGHVLWGALGMLLYGRRSRLSIEAAMVGAIGFAFSGALISQLSNLGLLCTLSWFPWLVLALESRLSWGAALVLALQVLCGQQQSVLVLLPAAILLYIVDGNDDAPVGQKLRSLAVCLLGGAVASCVVWLPGLELLSLTARRNLPTFGFNDQYSLGWSTLPSVLLPELDRSHLIADETSLYFIPTLLLAAALPTLWLSRGRRRRARAAMWGAALLAFLLSFGPKLFLGRWLVQYVPGFHQSRTALRWLFVTISMVAVLAAHGWDDLRHRIPRPILRWVLLGLLVIDVLMLGWSSYPTSEAESLGVPPSVHYAQHLSDQGRTLLVPPLSLRDFNWCLLTRTPTATGYDPLALGDYTEFVGFASRGRPLTDDERANLSYNINVFPWGGYSSRFLSLLSVANVAGHDRRGQAMVHKPVEGCLPRWYLVGAYDVVTDREETFRRIADPAFPLGRMALLDAPLASPHPAPQKSGPVAPAGGRVDLGSFEPNRIRLVTDCPEPAILVLSEMWYPGWRAYVDGQPVEQRRAFWILRAVPLPAKAHTVELVFEPVSLRIGLVVSALGFLVCLFGVWWQVVRLRRGA